MPVKKSKGILLNGYYEGMKEHRTSSWFCKQSEAAGQIGRTWPQPEAEQYRGAP